MSFNIIKRTDTINNNIANFDFRNITWNFTINHSICVYEKKSETTRTFSGKTFGKNCKNNVITQYNIIIGDNSLNNRIIGSNIVLENNCSNNTISSKNCVFENNCLNNKLHCCITSAN